MSQRLVPGIGLPSGRGLLAPAATLRSFPYPYRAMLAICSDIDGTRIDTFRETHRFMNTMEVTAAGPGVGLDIADSAWFYQPPYAGKVREQIAYFTDFSWKHPTPYADEIVEYARHGWIDTLHTYGNFNHAGELTVPFARAHALNALEALERNRVKLRVWVNHGDRNNRQNIGDYEVMQGDRPDAPEYHADLLRAHGTEYIWAHGRSDLAGGPSVVSAVPLNDGSHMFGFRRYNWRRNVPGASRVAAVYNLPLSPHRDDTLLQVWHPRALTFQIAEELLAEIVRDGHMCILGQHLGFMFPLATFDAETVAAFRRLRRFQDDGLILVARTSRLLHYHRVRDHLEFDVSEAEDGPVIDIRAVVDPVRGRWIPGIEDLRGITFEVGSNWPAELRVAGTPVDPGEIVVNPQNSLACCVGIRWFEPDRTDYALPFLSAERSSYVLWNDRARSQVAARDSAVRTVLIEECDAAARDAGRAVGPSEAKCALEQFENGLFPCVAAFERAGLSEFGYGLDVGCGPGRWAFAFLQHGQQVVGIDSRPELVKLATRLADRLGCTERANFLTGEITSLRLAENSFDCAWSHTPTVFINDAETVMGNVARVLRGGMPFFCRYNTDGYYIREICNHITSGQLHMLSCSSARYLNACLGRCGIFHTRGSRTRSLSVDDLRRIGRTFGMHYVGQPAILEQPTDFMGITATFDLVLRKIESPDQFREKLLQARGGSAAWLMDLNDIAASGCPALVCDVLRAVDPEIADPSVQDLYARSLIRAGHARGDVSTAFFEGGPSLPDLTMGLYCHDRGHYAKALACYERLEDRCADKAFLTGMGHFHGEDWHSARRAFAAAEQDATTDPRLWVGLIATYEKLGDRAGVFRSHDGFVSSLKDARGDKNGSTVCRGILW